MSVQFIILSQNLTRNVAFDEQNSASLKFLSIFLLNKLTILKYYALFIKNSDAQFSVSSALCGCALTRFDGPIGA